MNQRRHVTLVAGGATLLAALPLETVFERWTWLVDSVIVVGVVVGVAVLVRSFRVPLWAPVVAMAVAFVTIMSWVFSSGHELAGIIPTGATFRHWNDLLVSAGEDMRDFGVPVEDREGLLFLATLGVGLVGIVVDTCAVVLRRPALAGLPMLAIYSVPVAVNNDSVNFITFGAAAAGFLWLLVTDNVDRVRRFGRRFTGDGRDVDLWEPSPLSAAARRLAVVGVLLAVAMPVAVPGMTTGLLDRFGTGLAEGPGDGGGNGRGAAVSLFAQLHGELNAKKSFEMVKVTTDETDPYYLRFGTADELQPDGFRNRPSVNGQPVTGNLPSAVIGPFPGVGQRQYHATVQIVNLNMPLLPVYVQPTKTERLDSAWLYDREGGVVYSNRARSSGRKYSFDYVRTKYTVAALRTAKPLAGSDPIQGLYTRTPPVPKVNEIAASLTAAKPTQYDKVMAIFNYFSKENGFSYTLQTKPGTSGQDIVNFLNGKQGFCEQYSAAMAWLVRAAHIPARVAFGFTLGSTRTGDTYTLNNINLHAWTEVYFDKFGWVPFDPTPASSITGPVSPNWAPNPFAPTPTPSTGASGGASANPGANPGAVPTDEPGNDKGLPVQGTGSGSRSPIQRWPVWAGLALVFVVVLLLLPALARARLRRRRRPERLRPAGVPGPTVAVASDGPQMEVVDEGGIDAARRQAHAAWDELIDTMVDHGLPVDQSASPRTVAERVVTSAALNADAAEGARTLGQVEERARYARLPLHSERLTDELAGALRTVRRAIRHRVSTRTRLRALLLPPSVVQRWRTTTSVNAVSWSIGFGRRRDAALGALNPRRLLPGRASR